MPSIKNLEKEKIAKLKKIYKKYLAGEKITWEDPLVEDATFDSGYAIFSEISNLAGSRIDKMVLGSLTKEETKQILKKLEKII